MTSETSISPSTTAALQRAAALPRTSGSWLRAARVGAAVGAVLSALGLLSTVINSTPTVGEAALEFFVGTAIYIPASMVGAAAWLKTNPSRTGWVDLWLPVGLVAFIGVGILGAALVALGAGR